jgi:hypothetical protein
MATLSSTPRRRSSPSAGRLRRAGRRAGPTRSLAHIRRRCPGMRGRASRGGDRPRVGGARGSRPEIDAEQVDVGRGERREIVRWASASIAARFSGTGRARHPLGEPFANGLTRNAEMPGDRSRRLTGPIELERPGDAVRRMGHTNRCSHAPRTAKPPSENAGERSRTSTLLRAHGPEPCLSTSSSTPADAPDSVSAREPLLP